MNKERILLFRRIFNTIYSLSIVFAGICLIAGCLTIYFTGERTYSREIVSEVFSRICIPVYICLILTAISVVWEIIFPMSEIKGKYEKNFIYIYQKLTRKKLLSTGDKETVTYINKERKKRKIHIFIRTGIIVITSLIFLIYATNGNNFDQREVTDSMISAMWVLIPCLALSFGYAVFTAYYCERSILRETELLKKLPNAEISQTTKKISSHLPNLAVMLRVAFLAIAVAILVYGFFSGGTADVLAKATKICTECIGLG